MGRKIVIVTVVVVVFMVQISEAQGKISFFFIFSY